MLALESLESTRGSQSQLKWAFKITPGRNSIWRCVPGVDAPWSIHPWEGFSDLQDRVRGDLRPLRSPRMTPTQPHPTPPTQPIYYWEWNYSFISYVRLIFDLPLCNDRLCEEGLSTHAYETTSPKNKYNICSELTTSLGPRSRRVRVFQTFCILLPFQFFSFRDVFSIENITS